MAFAASAFADPITWEGSTNLTMTANTTVEIPAGTTGVVHYLKGAYKLTKTGGGTLVVQYPRTSGMSFVVSEGDVLFERNRRPDEVFAKAVYHVDASDISTMTLVEENGTNFVTRWNDVDGRNVYATPATQTIYGRTEPNERRPFIGATKLNGRPFVDFGSLLVPGYTNSNGVAKGYGAALIWNKSFSMRDGFSVVSDSPEISNLSLAKKLSDFSSHYGMSFFSNWEGNKGWSGVRGRLSRDHVPMLYTDNASNSGAVYGSGCTNWVDGTVTAYNESYPSGFHVFCRSAKGSTVSRFAMEYVGNSATYFGGQRIAEYAVFTNRLAASERDAVSDYLMAKWTWSPVSVTSIEVSEGAACTIEDDVGLTVKTYIDENDGKYAYSGQTVSLGNILYKVGAWIHLDASATNTMTISTENGTNFVSRWKDVDGGSNVAISDTFTGSGNFRTDVAKRIPYLNPTLRQNGLTVVDLGSALFNNYTNANTYGGAFWFDGCTTSDRTPSVKEYLAVISDTEDLKTVPTGSKYGPAYFAYYGPGSSAPRGGQVQGRRGAITKNTNPPLFESTTKAATSTGEDNGRFKDDGTAGRTFINGNNVSYTANPPDGFNVINIRPGTATLVNLIGRYQRYTSSSHFSTFGGQRVAEYMIFTSPLDDLKRERIYRALRVKWYGEEPLMYHGYKNLSVTDDARVEVKWEGITVTNTLEIAGAVSAPVVKAGNVVVSGANAAVDGALTIPDGAALSFSRGADGAWTSLSVKSLAAEGAVTVVLSADNQRGLGGTSARLVATENPPASLDGWTLEWDGRYAAGLVLREDGVWVEFINPGAVILVE